MSTRANMNKRHGIMNLYSLFRNVLSKIVLLICIVVMVQLSGCYSFTGGSVPDHLKTLQIAPVGDNSGYGNPAFKDKLSQQLFQKFKNDNSFSLLDRNGNARLNVSINGITDQTTVINPGELESERKITVSCEVEYFDAVKKKQIWKKQFSNYGIYNVTSNAQLNRNTAVETALERISDDILIAVVSGW
jgi:hypothetical protein